MANPQRSTHIDVLQLTKYTANPESTPDSDLRFLASVNDTLAYWNGSSWLALVPEGGNSATLNSAYDNGSTITVDNLAITLNGVNQDTAVLALTGDGDSAGALLTLSHTTNTRKDIDGTGSTWSVTGQGVAIFTQLNLGDAQALRLGASQDVVIQWVDASSFLDIQGNVNFDGDITIETPHILTMSGVAGSNTFTITAGDIIANDGSLTVIDADNAETVTIVNNTATTIGAGATAAIVQIESTSLTTGAALNVQLTEGTLNGGFYYSAWDNTAGARVWSVGEDGVTTIAGVGGSNVLTLTAGDMVMSDGSLTITDADNAATFTVTNNSLTSGMGATISSTGVLTTTGGLLTLTANSATTAAGLFRINANGLTSGIGAVITSTATAITGAGRLLRVDHTGTTGTSAILSEFASAATDETTILRVTASAALAAGVVLDLVGASVTTGTILDMSGLNALTTGSALVINSNSADTGTRSLVSIVNDNAASTGTTGLTIQQDADMPAITITGLTTVGIDFTALGVADSLWNCTATTDVVNVSPESDAETGFIKIDVAGAPRYIPFYTLVP